MTELHPGGGLRLGGVDHIALVTWDPAATCDFYTQVLDLPLVHAITATGWLKEEFPISSTSSSSWARATTSRSSTSSASRRRNRPHDLMHRSRHLAFHVDTEEEMLAWREKIKSHGVRVTHPMQHELLESIYFDDPNGIQLEIARPLRPFGDVDARDAELTLVALADVAGKADATVQDMWRRKAEIVRTHAGKENS